MPRLFVAIDFSEKEKEVIGLLVNSHFSQYPSIKWIPKENLHVTLKFLGNISEEKVGKIERCLTKVSKEFQPFSISAVRFGIFNREPLVILLEIEKNREIEQLARRVDEEMSQPGFPKENRHFYPHVTLGKIMGLAPVEKNSIVQQVEKMRIDPPLTFRVYEFVLMESKLKPSGAIYLPHARFFLYSQELDRSVRK